MKIIGWIAFVSFGLMAISTLGYLAVGLATRGGLVGADAALVVFGLLALSVCRTIYRVILADGKRNTKNRD